MLGPYLWKIVSKLVWVECQYSSMAMTGSSFHTKDWAWKGRNLASFWINHVAKFQLMLQQMLGIFIQWEVLVSPLRSWIKVTEMGGGASNWHIHKPAVNIPQKYIVHIPSASVLTAPKDQNKYFVSPETEDSVTPKVALSHCEGWGTIGNLLLYVIRRKPIGSHFCGVFWCYNGKQQTSW